MNYYNEIKQELINNETYKKVKDYSKNRSDLEAYCNVGRLLSEAGKHYGEGIIKEYSNKLTIELGIKYTSRTLFRIKQFYELFLNEKVSTLSTQLTWSHYCELLPIKDINIINYYINVSIKQNLSVRELRKEHIGQIKMYMNYIDKNIKEIHQDKTIGIIICKKDNVFVMEYCSDNRIYRTIYECI